MTEPELLQLIDRVENDLANNWAVDKDDIKALIDIIRKPSSVDLEFIDRHELKLFNAWCNKKTE